MCLKDVVAKELSPSIVNSTDPRNTKKYQKSLKKYVKKIKRHITKKWQLPEKYFAESRSNSSLISKVVLKIDHKGEIILVEWESKSGFSDFDDSCLRAIYSAVPYPLPPEDLETEVYSEGFLIEFNPFLSAVD